MTNAEIIAAVLGVEKGFVDDPNDDGGPTNWGITMPVLEKWRGRPVTLEDILKLSRDEAIQIYTKLYVADWDFDQLLDDNLRWAVVDSGVHQGQGSATRMLQTAARVEPDGHLGPISLNAINSLPPRLALARFLAERARRYGRTITDDAREAQKTGGIGDAAFAAGWMNRLAPFIELLGD